MGAEIPDAIRNKAIQMTVDLEKVVLEQLDKIADELSASRLRGNVHVHAMVEIRDHESGEYYPFINDNKSLPFGKRRKQP